MVAAGELLVGPEMFPGMLRFAAQDFWPLGSPESAVGAERASLEATLPTLLVRSGPVADPGGAARFWVRDIVRRWFGAAMPTAISAVSAAAGAGLHARWDLLDVLAAAVDTRPVGFLNISKAPNLGFGTVCAAGATSPWPSVAEDRFADGGVVAGDSHCVPSCSSSSAAARMCVLIVFLDLALFLIARWDDHIPSPAVRPALDATLVSGMAAVPSAFGADLKGLTAPQAGDMVIAWALPRPPGCGAASGVPAVGPSAGRDEWAGPLVADASASDAWSKIKEDGSGGDGDRACVANAAPAAALGDRFVRCVATTRVHLLLWGAGDWSLVTVAGRFRLNPAAAAFLGPPPAASPSAEGLWTRTISDSSAPEGARLRLPVAWPVLVAEPGNADAGRNALSPDPPEGLAFATLLSLTRLVSIVVPRKAGSEVRLEVAVEHAPRAATIGALAAGACRALFSSVTVRAQAIALNLWALEESPTLDLIGAALRLLARAGASARICAPPWFASSAPASACTVRGESRRLALRVPPLQHRGGGALPS